MLISISLYSLVVYVILTNNDNLFINKSMQYHANTALDIAPFPHPAPFPQLPHII